MPGTSPSGLRRRNRDVVLRMIARHAPVSRTHIARRSGLTGAAVSRIIGELIEAGLVREGAQIRTKGQVGRRNIALELCPNGAYVLGIALAANVRSVCIANCRGEIVAGRKVPGLDMDDPGATIDRLCAEAASLVTASGIDRSRLMGCGISIAGVPDPDTGDLVHAHHLGWAPRPLGREFAERLALPVRVEARPVALLMAELWGGAAAGKRNVVLVSNGIWIGGAIMMDGVVLRGHRNMAGQLPHMRIAHTDARCFCGRTGCLNAVASGQAVMDRLTHLAIPGLEGDVEPGERLQHLAQLRGPRFRDVAQTFREAGRHMGHAIDNIMELLDPELVLMAGAAGRHPDYIDGLKETLAALRPGENDWPVQASEVTSDQSAIWMGLDAFVYSQSLDIEQLTAA
ncbi:MAG: ROK family transcriptional regulator [Alphaproteobacteria bacterium]|nr:MAG: ROK family transcriptional regulator [Alphaproteobacteria bacterium]